MYIFDYIFIKLNFHQKKVVCFFVQMYTYIFFISIYIYTYSICVYNV